MIKKGYSIVQLRNILLVINLLLFNNILLPSIVGTACYWLFLAVSAIVVVKEKINLNVGYRVLAILYCLFAIISTMLSQYFSVSTLFSVCQFVLWTLMIVFTDADNIEDILVKYLNILTKVICVAVVYSFILKHFGSMRFAEKCYENYLFTPYIKQYAMGMVGEIGYAAFYQNTNIFGFLVVVVTIWNVCAGRVKCNLRGICFIVLMAVGLVLSYSRAATVCCILGLIMIAFFRSKKQTKIFVCLIAFVGAVCYLAISGTGAISGSEVDLAGREEMWEIMWKTFMENKLFGIGFANSTKYVLSNIGSHNSYLNILVENGIVGMFFFVLIMVSIINSIFKTQEYMKEWELYFFAAVLFLVYIPYAFIENAIMIFETRHTIWILLGMYIAEKRKMIK